MIYTNLEEVKAHLRYDDDANDEMLTAYALSAEQMVHAYITDPVDSQNEPVIKVAVLLLIGYLDSNRDAMGGEQHGNYLPPQVRQLLSPYRTPTAS